MDTIDAPTPSINSVQRELARGLVCARQAHYADAATHFSVARGGLSEVHSRLLAALDAFVESHARYWQAQQALHELSHQFVVASTDQEARLADLQEALAAAAGDRTIVVATELRSDHSTVANSGVGRGQPSLVTEEPRPALRITCFGRFAVRRFGAPVKLCQNRSGQAILRYLVAQPHHRATVDVLMELLWREDAPEVARHKLHVAVSALRQSLNVNDGMGNTASYLHRDGNAYQLADSVTLEIDIEEFEALFRAGQQCDAAAAVAHYEAACALYAGPFLAEDLYADWAVIRREQLAQAYVTMCGVLADYYLEHGRYGDAARWANSILEEDRCNEAAYRQVMRAHAAVGRRVEALRQYQRCERLLAEELGVQPVSETTALFYAILGDEHTPGGSQVDAS